MQVAWRVAWGVAHRGDMDGMGGMGVAQGWHGWYEGWHGGLHRGSHGAGTGWHHNVDRVAPQLGRHLVALLWDVVPVQ